MFERNLGDLVGRELKRIRQRLEAIEEALAEATTAEDKRDLKEALAERKRGKSVSFSKVRKFCECSSPEKPVCFLESVQRGSKQGSKELSRS